MSRPLLAKARVTFSGVDVYDRSGCAFKMSAGEAIHLYRSLRRNMKRIRKNARLWEEQY